MKVAQTILAQLGGNHFVVMTGSKNFVGGSDSLSFSVGRGAKDKINKVRITLDANDTYTVEYFYLRGVNLKEVAKSEGLYFDMLQSDFTEKTGFFTKL